MTANEIRKKFLDFFKSKGHTIVASDSVVPKNDPTVLFTTAGMQQFKRQFLGHIGDYTRAASSQKCLRTDDLDKIGKTPCHHTFFEMLGNFSFGDYFKKEAIEYAWEFLTQHMLLPKDKLWVSVYRDDEEAHNEWVQIGFPQDRIVKLGDKDNFWPAEAKTKGPNGPCGPCSEIFYDYGKGEISDCKNPKCDPSCSCGRFTEIWNLVFTQFNRKEGGVLEPLPNKNIDTGMGLERLAAVAQGKKNNYETDLFGPILEAIEKETKSNGYSLTDTEKRIIADHIRAIVFAIADGVIPSNEGRGYVVKRLIIDAADILIPVGRIRSRLYKLVPAVVSVMQSYRELHNKADNISSTIQVVQEAYLNVRNEKLPKLIEKLKTADPGEIGQLIFEAKDTHGLTLSRIKDALFKANINDKNQKIAFEDYERLMEKQKKRSRAASKMTGERFADIELDLTGIPRTKFIGYEHTKSEATILKIFIDAKEVNQVSQGDHVQVILDQTPFYAEAGGQIGDTGILTGKQGTIRVLDTQKQDDIYIHFGEVEKGEIKIEDRARAQINEDRRWSIMRNHTATHLLQSALREILGTHVQQQGSLVAEDRLRFDFTHPKALTKEELAQIEAKIVEHVKYNDQVVKEEMSLAEAEKKGALAFFAEKYKDRVRVISIGSYSKEFCGGTHLDSTGEIKHFVISSEGAVAQGIRRIEARTENWAVQFMKDCAEKDMERKHSQEKRQQELEERKKEDQRRLQEFKNNLPTIIAAAETVDNTKIVVHTFTSSDSNQLKDFSDLIKQQIPSVIVCLGSTANNSISVVVGITEDLIKRGIKASDLIKDIAPLINGSGGGRPELAQAGSKDIHKLNSAIIKAKQLIKEKLTL
jgi:alanyl-tRNA synthetase